MTVLLGVTVGVRVGVTYCTAGGRNVTARSMFLGLQADAVSVAKAIPAQWIIHFAIDKFVIFRLG